jgi:hypothetical protein
MINLAKVCLYGIGRNPAGYLCHKYAGRRRRPTIITSSLSSFNRWSRDSTSWRAYISPLYGTTTPDLLYTCGGGLGHGRPVGTKE